jgi:hypothetical protein
MRLVSPEWGVRLTALRPFTGLNPSLLNRYDFKMEFILSRRLDMVSVAFDRVICEPPMPCFNGIR